MFSKPLRKEFLYLCGPQAAGAGEERDVIDAHGAKHIVAAHTLEGDEVGCVGDKGDLGKEPGRLLLVGQGPQQPRLCRRCHLVA